MRRKLLIGLLAFGTVAGFGSGFFSMAHGGCRNHHAQRRAAFERHVADVCVEAAQRADRRADRRDGRGGDWDRFDHRGHHHGRHGHPGERPPPPPQQP
jgi:hypothetical protein